VAIAGAGPAGSFAAAILARAGLRVRVFDRARFPRPKLCGDTLNPGALAVLRRHVDIAPLIETSDPIRGMLLTGPGGVRVRGEYGAGITGRSITRETLDAWLLDRAAEAGATIEPGVAIRDVAGGDDRVSGVITAGRNGESLKHPARMVIAADGRRSTIAIGRGLSKQPRRPRRWAIGGYFTDVSGMTTVGEMHVRRGHYIGVAPVPGGLANACLVVPGERSDLPLARPAEALGMFLKSDPELADRFARARPVAKPVMLGPMAVDTTAAGEPGLLLAGDAAGFIDPMTGDGLRFAVRDGELAARAALRALEHGWTGVHTDHAARRRAEFSGKWRVNRALRALVGSPRLLAAAGAGARLAPAAVQALVTWAGDCRLAAPSGAACEGQPPIGHRRCQIER
jgi:flavin-dependent dehydrogenase